MISCIKCGAKSEKCFSSLHSVCTAAAGEPKVPFKYFNHYKPLLTLHLCHIFQASYQICIFVIVVISPVFVDILKCLFLVFIIQKVSRVLFFSLYVCPALKEGKVEDSVFILISYLYSTWISLLKIKFETCNNSSVKTMSVQ